MEMQGDRNATNDHIKSYNVTKYQRLIKKLTKPGAAKQGNTLCLETYSNQQTSSSTTDAWQGCTSIEERLILTCFPSMKSHICLNDEHVPKISQKYSWQVIRK